MKGTAKSKVVTSGRLTGAVRGQIYRRRGTPDPGPAACPKPAYSLYSTSTESEEQVSSLHKGLDRCAALLTNILQVDKADPHMAATSGSPCSSLRKRTIKNTKKDHRGRQPGPGFKAHRPVRKPSTDPTQTSSHSPQTILYPPGTSIPPSQTSIPPCETSIHQPPTSIPPSQTSIPPCETSIHQPPTSIPPSQTSIPPCETSIHQPPTSIPPSQTPIPPCETSIRQPLTSIPPSQTSIPPCEASIDPSQPSIHPPQTSLHLPQTSTSHAYCRVGWDREEAEFVPVRDISVQSCPKRSDMRLGLGQVDRVLLDTPGGRDCKGETDEKVKTVHYLLGELKALIAGQVWTLQEELSTAQSQLQEVQDDLTELRKALEETQSRLTDREAEKALIQTELEATRSRLLDSERERSELASLAQQRLEDIGNLNRMLQCPPSSSVSDNRHLFTQHRPESDRITQYLMSLGQLEPIPSEHVSAEREVIPIPHRKGGARAAHATVLFQSCHVDQSHGSIRNPHQAPSCCDVESLSSNCSSSSGSTFDTRDEVAFRAGLEALDASIASLQRTIQLDTRR
ncbi:uncharacterized protein ccdc14 isoform X2 [Pungitius pungitius]|uniref:uncharacterized protein ccdc14 isoform X2 n=1 Tax=Pungitius pungitius TaxID=134920 RepID=UPI0018898051|nr:uncharacterized protein ccdc14 isoform X2 [Pungitius pungitius]